MGKLKDVMLTKTNSHFVNKPGWGISFMIDGHKFFAKEGSDLCDLVRSIIMDSVDAIKRTIDVRGYEENVVYTRTNEAHVKRCNGSAIFNKVDLFEAIVKERAEKKQKKKEIKKEVEEVKEEKPKTPTAKVVKVNIAQELSKLINPSYKSNVEVVREVVSKPSVVESLLGKKSIAETQKVEVKENVVKENIIKTNNDNSADEIFKQYENKLKELKVEKITRDDARKYHIQYKRVANDNFTKFLEMYAEWKTQQKAENSKELDVFKQYEKKLKELKVEKITRDDARKYHIPYGSISNNNYTMFLEMYNNWKSNH